MTRGQGGSDRGSTDGERVVTWAYPKGVRLVNLFGATVYIRFCKWPAGAGGGSRQLEVRVWERDLLSEGDEDDLLAIFPGTLFPSDDGTLRFMPSETFTLIDTFEGQVETVRDAFKLGFALPGGGTAKTYSIALQRGVDEDESRSQAFDVYFTVREDGQRVCSSHDHALAFLKRTATGDACKIDVPPLNQSARKSNPFGSDALGYVEEEHYPHRERPTDSPNNADYYAAWTASKRTFPVLDTTQDTLDHADAKHLLGDDAPTLASAPVECVTTVDGVRRPVLTHNKWVMNPYVQSSGKRVAETLGFGGCKLTSAALALLVTGAYDRVLRLLKDGDAALGYAGDKAMEFFPITCSTERSCRPKPSSAFCHECERATHVGRKDRDQLSPFSIAGYVWWLITSLEGGHKDSNGYFVKGTGNVFLQRDETRTDSRGHRLIRDYFGCEVLLDETALDRTGDMEERYGLQMRHVIAQGVPVLAWVHNTTGGKGGGHVILIHGYSRWTDTNNDDEKHWLYDFIDPAKGGWWEKCTIKRFYRLLAFAPPDFIPGDDHFVTS